MGLDLNWFVLEISHECETIGIHCHPVGRLLARVAMRDIHRTRQSVDEIELRRSCSRYGRVSSLRRLRKR